MLDTDEGPRGREKGVAAPPSRPPYRKIVMYAVGAAVLIWTAMTAQHTHSPEDVTAHRAGTTSQAH